MAVISQQNVTFQTRLKEAAAEANSPLVSSEGEPGLFRLLTEIVTEVFSAKVGSSGK
jgi:hypothetical protein